jgi:hypothetical protein
MQNRTRSDGPLRALLHVYESVYDSMYDLQTKLMGIRFIILTQIQLSVYTCQVFFYNIHLLNTFGTKSYMESYGGSYAESDTCIFQPQKLNFHAK